MSSIEPSGQEARAYSPLEMANSSPTKFLNISDLTVKYGSLTALDSISLSVSESEVVTVVGPSGAGKTTLLFAIAGLLDSSVAKTTGKIFLNGQNISSLPPEKREAPLVFQNGALFPHLSVRENILFPLKCAGVDKSTQESKVSELLSLVELSEVENRKPHQLSGGQAQRVAIARALAASSKLLLLDEPFASLDPPLRRRLQRELKNIHLRLHNAIVHVTHSIDEAMFLADRLVLLNKGKIEQEGNPEELFLRPKNSFVANFVGHSNFLSGIIVNSSIRTVTVKLQNGTVLEVLTDSDLSSGIEVVVIARPDLAQVFTQPLSSDDLFLLSGNLKETAIEGHFLNLWVETELGILECLHSIDRANILPPCGEKLMIGWRKQDLMVVPDTKG